LYSRDAFDFSVGRHDILPADDFGVRTGFRHAYKKREMPTPRELLAHGEIWRPHRTNRRVVSLVRRAR